MKAVLERRESGDQGTFGMLYSGSYRAYSGELPWLENALSVSCIPAGLYQVAWTWSPRFRRMMYLLLGTAPRSGIRAHPANLMGNKEKGYRAQLNGCIALGERVGWIEGQKALLLSGPAVRRFEEFMQRKSFELEITCA